MNHAFLIQAHHNPDYLVRLINWLDAPNHFIFVHIDKKSKVMLDLLYANEISHRNNVYVFSEISVNWGGYSQIACMSRLFAEALKNKSIEWFHHISGADIPLMDNKTFDDFFEFSKYKGYIKSSKNDKWLISEMQRRFLVYRFNDIVNMRSKNVFTYALRFLERLQLFLTRYLKIKVRKNINYEPALGSNWFSLKREVMEYIVDFVNSNPSYDRRFQHTCCCDEMYFHMMLKASPYWNCFFDSDLRFVEWKKLDIGEMPPHTLTELNYEDIKNSNSIFARKIDPVKSEKLIGIIEKEFLKQ